MLSLIAARSRNGAIGRNGSMPWEAPEDLAMFKRETQGGALIMGRRTWESLPLRPLPGRDNFVVSRDRAQYEHVFESPVLAAVEARSRGLTRIYGIGGASVYAALMPYATRMLITEIDLIVPDADTFFPDFDESEWREESGLEIRDAAPTCRVRELVRRHKPMRLPDHVLDPV